MILCGLDDANLSEHICNTRQSFCVGVSKVLEIFVVVIHVQMHANHEKSGDILLYVYNCLQSNNICN